MELRKLCSPDTAAIERLHAAMNLGYKLPEPGELFVKLGIFDKSRLVTAVLGRKTSEAYLLLDRAWADPKERWETIKRNIVAAAEQAKLDGISDVHVWLPPVIEGRFTERLENELAFVKAPWNCYTARL